MWFKKKYTVKAYKYIDKFYVKIYHKNAQYGYMSVYINGITLETLQKWYLSEVESNIEIQDLSIDKLILSKSGLYALSSEQQKEWYKSDEYDTEEQAEQASKTLGSEWHDVKVRRN